jgi:hypothetical protein
MVSVIDQAAETSLIAGRSCGACRNVPAVEPQNMAVKARAVKTNFLMGRNPKRRRRHTSPQNQQTVAWVTASWLRGPNRGGEDTMRTFFTAIGMAVGLLAVWAALVPFVS